VVNRSRSAAFTGQALGAFDPGTTMSQHKQPSKESIRQWLQARLVQRRPPPDPQQIRRELGWDLIRPLQEKR
jgi:hypothetical protein